MPSFDENEPQEGFVLESRAELSPNSRLDFKAEMRPNDEEWSLGVKAEHEINATTLLADIEMVGYTVSTSDIPNGLNVGIGVEHHFTDSFSMLGKAGVETNTDLNEPAGTMTLEATYSF